MNASGRADMDNWEEEGRTCVCNSWPCWWKGQLGAASVAQAGPTPSSLTAAITWPRYWWGRSFCLGFGLPWAFCVCARVEGEVMDGQLADSSLALFPEEGQYPGASTPLCSLTCLFED